MEHGGFWWSTRGERERERELIVAEDGNEEQQNLIVFSYSSSCWQGKSTIESNSLSKKTLEKDNSF